MSFPATRLSVVQRTRSGDVLGRYLVRLEEMRQAQSIIEQLIDNVPAGPIDQFPFEKRPEVLPGKQEVYFSIEGDTLRGFTGCNEFTASVTQFSETISISNVVETDAACPSEAAATNEARLLGVLPSITRFARHGKSLQLLSDRAQPDALVLAREDDFATLAE